MPKSTDINSLLQLISTCEINKQKYVCIDILYLLSLVAINSNIIDLTHQQRGTTAKLYSNT